MGGVVSNVSGSYGDTGAWCYMGVGVSSVG